MPIYAYRCDACGFTQDVLQKLSDSPLSECPSCHAQELHKQVTAAGFQLKGSGWYATDFRNPPAAPTKAADSIGDAKLKKEGDAAVPAAGGNTTPASSPEPAKNTAESAVSANSSSGGPGCASH